MSSTKVITGLARFSYAHVFEPHAMEEGQQPKYSVSILIPKKDKKTLDKIESAVKAAIEEGKSKWGGKVPAKLKTPLRDGDEERPDDEIYAGHMFLSASSNRRPGVVDAQLNEIIDKDEFYSGCYGIASLNFYAFAVAGSRGVAVGLNNLMKKKDGERLGGGGASAAEDFADFAEDDDMMG